MFRRIFLRKSLIAAVTLVMAAAPSIARADASGTLRTSPYQFAHWLGFDLHDVAVTHDYGLTSETFLNSSDPAPPRPRRDPAGPRPSPSPRSAPPAAKPSRGSVPPDRERLDRPRRRPRLPRPGDHHAGPAGPADLGRPGHHRRGAIDLRRGPGPPGSLAPRRRLLGLDPAGPP